MALYDVIVLGLGGMGSAAAFQLASRGKRVIGFDQHPPAHDRGASHGHTRIIREAYFEHPSYVPLVWRAYELWAELEQASGKLLLLTTGGIMIGAPDGPLVRGALESARVHSLSHEVLDAADVQGRFPVFAPAADMVGVLEPRAGILFPEECVLAHLRQAARAGAELHHEEAVLAWSAAPHVVTVSTPRGRYEAGALVIAPGPWAPEVLADLGVPVVIERQVVPWFRPAAMETAFDPARCPVYIWHVAGRLFYGFPQLAFDGVKVAEHARGDETTADGVRREISPAEIESLRRDFVAPYMPAANGPMLSAVTCLYSMTPDTHFILDHHPAHENVLVACGFSGHGFKFTPVIGEILADLALEGRTGHDISLFTLGRFARG